MCYCVSWLGLDPCGLHVVRHLHRVIARKCAGRHEEAVHGSSIGQKLMEVLAKWQQKCDNCQLKLACYFVPKFNKAATFAVITVRSWSGWERLTDLR